jgi:hypothetical protein
MAQPTNPLEEIVRRMVNTAILHGTAFCKVTYDVKTDNFQFVVVPADEYGIEPQYEQE